jgi:iron complex outermembrane receptor protein
MESSTGAPCLPALRPGVPLVPGLLSLGLTLGAGDVAAQMETAPAATLKKMSLEELMDVEVTSVSKRPQSLYDAAASIYVISAEDIRRAGVTSLEEALRLAPNLQVARVGAAQYAITARGFNNAVGNKLLVLIDGRTVYTSLFSGVFWEQQDVMLEDIERIEVISGPGATLWGANAVNGVINVITRPSGATQGPLVSAGIGTDESNLAFRYGGALGARGHYRVYAKRTNLADTENAAGVIVMRDGWKMEQVGFRSDWGGEDQDFTFQGDAYWGETEDRGFFGPFRLTAVEASGMNLLLRWNKRLAGGSDLRLQAYYDHSRRQEVFLFQPEQDVLDVEFQHGIPLGAHKIMWGGGYRHGSDEVEPGFFTTFIPDSRDLNWSNVFLQDEFTLTRSIQLTAGIKLAHNDYTGLEYLPSMRLAWKPSDAHLLWMAASRAVRTPSRLDKDIFFPQTPPFIVAGGPDFESEVAKVLELGYRGQPAQVLSWSVTLFYHDWDDLRSGTPLPIPTYLVNNIEGYAYGVETWANWQAARYWRLSGGLTNLQKRLVFKPGASDTAGTRNDTLHNDPELQWTLRSSIDLPRGAELDVGVRRVSSLPHPEVPGYVAVDARLGWSPAPGMELSLTGRNLLDEHHAEFGEEAARSELERSAYFKVVWSY